MEDWSQKTVPLNTSHDHPKEVVAGLMMSGNSGSTVSLPQPPHTGERQQENSFAINVNHSILYVHTFEFPGTSGGVQAVVCCREFSLAVDTLDSGDCAIV